MIPDQFIYLLLALYFLIVWAIALFVRPDLKRMMLKASLFGAFAGPISEYWYFRDYWLPPTLFGQGVPSLEDVLFGWAVFGLGVVLYPIVTHMSVQKSGEKHPRLIAAIILSIVIGFVVLTDILHLNSIFSTFILFLAWTIIVCVLRRDFILPALCSGVIMTLLMLPIYVGLLKAAPAYVDNYWLLSGTRWTVTIFGSVPLTEIIWYFVIGCFAGAVPQFAKEIRYVKKHHRKKEAHIIQL